MTSAEYWVLLFAAFGLLAAWAVIKGISDD
jgi:hypothetical protein